MNRKRCWRIRLTGHVVFNVGPNIQIVLWYNGSIKTCTKNMLKYVGGEGAPLTSLLPSQSRRILPNSVTHYLFLLVTHYYVLIVIHNPVVNGLFYPIIVQPDYSGIDFLLLSVYENTKVVDDHSYYEEEEQCMFEYFGENEG